MSQKGFSAIFLLIGLIILSAVAGGAFYLGIQTSSKAVSPIISTKSTVTPSLQPYINTPAETNNLRTYAAETNNLKTYTNETHKFSFKYSPEKTVRIICPGDGENFYLTRRSSEVEDEISSPTCARDSRYPIEISYTENQYNSETIKNNPNYKVEEEAILVSNINANKYTFTLNPNANGPYEPWSQTVYLRHNNMTYVFYLGAKDLITEFNQIISTFKFAE